MSYFTRLYVEGVCPIMEAAHPVAVDVPLWAVSRAVQVLALRR